jgi:hypothetical protein
MFPANNYVAECLSVAQHSPAALRVPAAARAGFPAFVAKNSARRDEKAAKGGGGYGFSAMLSLTNPAPELDVAPKWWPFSYYDFG